MNIYTKDKNGYLCFTSKLFQFCMSNTFGDPNLKVLSAELDSSAYETDTAKAKYHENKKLLGIFKYRVSYISFSKMYKANILVKSKISYSEYLHLISDILLKSGIDLEANCLSTLLDKTSIYNNMLKEINIFNMAINHHELASFLPKIYGTYIDIENDIYLIFEEYLGNAYLMHDYQDLKFWQHDKILAAVKDLAKFHALFYGKTHDIAKENWLGTLIDTEKMLGLNPLWQATAKNLTGLISQEELKKHYDLINTIQEWYPEIDKQPKTLIYNDIQVRNIAMRNQEELPQLCLYDWEVATIHIPQRDLVEFLGYLILPETSDSQIQQYLEISRQTLELSSGLSISAKDWIIGCSYALYDYQIDRLALQLNLHKVIERVDIMRVWQSSRRLLQYLSSQIF